MQKHLFILLQNMTIIWKQYLPAYSQTLQKYINQRIYFNKILQHVSHLQYDFNRNLAWCPDIICSWILRYAWFGTHGKLASTIGTSTTSLLPCEDKYDQFASTSKISLLPQVRSNCFNPEGQVRSMSTKKLFFQLRKPHTFYMK